MNISESPTQANDGRDYETARHSLYDPEPETSSHDEGHTLRDDDTGAVNFGPLTQDKTAPPLSDEFSPPAARDSWRDSQPDDQHDMGTTPARPAFAPLPPETPVAVVNPFQNKGGASILRATQLFNATQMSAVKPFSPTSSRPSPSTFPAPFMSTSPADLGTSPLKHRRPELSSPSASTPLGPPTSFLVPPTPAARRRDHTEAIPESPTDNDESGGGPPRKRRRQGLLEEYEPVAMSQERKLFPMDGAEGTDEESEPEQFRRRQRARRIREDAERQLDKVSLRLSRDRPFRRVASSPQVAGRRASPRRASPRQRSEGPVLIPASSGTLPSQIPQSSSPAGERRGDGATSSRARVPESPVAVPESDFADGVHSDDGVEDVQGEGQGVGRGEAMGDEGDEMPPTQPPWSAEAEAHPGPSPVLDDGKHPTQLPPFSKPKDHSSPAAAPVSSLPPPNNPGSPPAPGSIPSATPPGPNHTIIPPIKTGTPLPGSSESSLSPLTATPSPATSPKARTPTPSSQPGCYDLPSSADFELPPPRPRRPPKKTYSRAPARKSLPRRGTNSPDELASAPVHPQRRSRSARPDSPLLFTNMAFAISFQGRRDTESAEEHDARCAGGEELASLVARAGGRVLAGGFSELLDEGGELAPGARGLGFTALLADGHSRKVKYMQALALGLPCLAYQWATASLSRGVLQEWAPYLLSPGESAPLGGAVLSRQLAPYPAGDARLSEVVGRRALLLGGSRILLVMKKARGGEGGKAYLALARIVGAGVTRVFNVREARKALKKGGFEWVYVDEETGSPGQVLGEGKGEVRCLSNERIIQSLIAGRVVDEGERGAHGL